MDLVMRSERTSLEPGRITTTESGKVGLSTDECFILDFFRNVGALDFASYPYDNFLYRVVRQLGESQPSVKHAVMALTAKGHEDASCYFGNAQGKLDDFVLRQTTKSIMYLLQQPTSKDTAGIRVQREVILATCAIFILLANCEDDLERFKLHLMHGQRAMQEWEGADFENSLVGPTLSEVLFHLDYKLQIVANPASYLQLDNPLLLDSPDMANFSPTTEYAMDPHWDL